MKEICGGRINHQKFHTMKNNISTIDRVARLLIAAVIAILYFTNQIEGTLAFVLGLTAVVVARTAVFNFCPIYYLFGLSTRKKSAQS